MTDEGRGPGKRDTMTDPDQPPPPDIPRARVRALFAILLADAPYVHVQSSADLAALEMRRPKEIPELTPMIDNLMGRLSK